jgi:hypothetical protein
MSADLRLCTLCQQLIDIDSPSIEVLASGRGGIGRKTTVRDRVTGLPHILLTRCETEKRAQAMAQATSGINKTGRSEEWRQCEKRGCKKWGYTRFCHKHFQEQVTQQIDRGNVVPRKTPGEIAAAQEK